MILSIYYESIRECLNKEYRANHPQGYSISRFNDLINRYLDEKRPVMHIKHKAGDKLYCWVN
ncbi:hypothetical protein FACS189413_15060 [Bacteroidia bacterium]|nr:hypothetical protein FACS189413_15060 [Bacteroidia bacterium]